jgi:hypothetical protein
MPRGNQPPPPIGRGPAPTEAADEIDELMASPPLRLEDLFDDPAVRQRIGEWIALAMSRPDRRRRKL